MTKDEIWNYLAERGATLGAPYYNGEKPFLLEQTVSITGWEVLWEYGYRKAGVELVDAGEEQHFVECQLTRLKNHLGIVEKQDVVNVPDWLEPLLQTDFLDETSEEESLDIVRLDERLVKWIPDFRVEMYTDESKHRGRPHVAVYLKTGKISVSLEDPPINLTPRGGLVGETKALKVIKKNRKALLQLWDETRVDTQRLI